MSYEKYAKNALIQLIYNRLNERSNENEEDIHKINCDNKQVNRVINTINSVKFTYMQCIDSYSLLKRPEELYDKLFNQCVNLIEITILLSFKRFAIELPPNCLFNEEGNDFGFFDEKTQIFKNKEIAEKAIELLPLEQKNLIFSLENLVLDEKYEDFFSMIDEKAYEIYGFSLEESEDMGKYHSPQKKKSKKLQHKRSRSTFI